MDAKIYGKNEVTKILSEALYLAAQEIAQRRDTNEKLTEARTMDIYYEYIEKVEGDS